MMKSYVPTDKIVAEQMLYGNFIKYKSLARIVNEEFAGSGANHINIFIDLYSFLTPLYRLTRLESPFSITSAIINYCAHLRSFFRRSYGVETNIILIYSTNNNPISIRRYLPDFNVVYEMMMANNQSMYKLVESNLRLLSMICPYLPEIYFKEGTCHTGVIVKDISENELFGNIPNMLICSSHNSYNIPGSVYNLVVVHKKSIKGGEDTSFAINRLNCTKIFMQREKTYTNCENVFVNPKLITLFMVLAGNSRIGIPTTTRSLKSILEFLNLIPEGMEKDLQTIGTIFSQFARTHSVNITTEELLARITGLDIDIQHSIYKTLPESDISNFLIRMRDPDTVKYINDKYFAKCPIDLERL